MRTEKLTPIKKVALKNHCPECFSKEGLHLTFKQRFVENAFYKVITKDIAQEINCHTCDSIIYPERWTNDIERVFEYQRKTFTPRPYSKYFKTLFWILLILGLILTFAIIIILSFKIA